MRTPHQRSNDNYAKRLRAEGSAAEPTRPSLEALIAELDKHGLAAVPKEPTREMLEIIWRRKWPEDFNAGKRAQLKHGLTRVPPKTEAEMAWGQYERLLEAAIRAGQRAQSRDEDPPA